MRRFGFFLGLVLLLLSLVLLTWGLSPTLRERLSLPITPTEMTLPTPNSTNLEPSFVGAG
jgi:hypothetical protein